MAEEVAPTMSQQLSDIQAGFKDRRKYFRGNRDAEKSAGGREPVQLYQG